MKSTKFRDLGPAGRLLVSFGVGFAATTAFLILALLAATLLGGWSAIVAAPLLPGLALATALNLHNGDVGELFGAWWINAGFYGLLAFLIWQRQVSKAKRIIAIPPKAPRLDT